jgi:tRNA pseudouridine38-40 synthase
MARYQIILAYDGTEFAGFQRQELTARTVQGEVEDALQRLGWTARTIYSAGRTDTGVHASGQVIAFDLDWKHSPEALCLALNANLPKDVAAQSATVAPDQFHPRYDATARRYRYNLFCQGLREPLRERFAWRVWPPVELERMQAAASLLPGSHDFAAFGAPLRPGGVTVREVWQASWQENGGTGFCFEIQANAFLYHMVRRLVFLQVKVGQGSLAVEDFAQGLKTCQSQPSGLAPAHGLALVEVLYKPFGQDIGS